MKSITKNKQPGRNARIFLMTDKDKNLIYQAKILPYTLWPHIDAFIEDADTPEAKEKLTNIQKRKYHYEESRP